MICRTRHIYAVLNLVLTFVTRLHSPPSINFPAKLTSKYSVRGVDTLSVTLQIKDAEGKSVHPHQAFLILTNEETGVQSAQVLQVRGGKARAEVVS